MARNHHHHHLKHNENGTQNVAQSPGKTTALTASLVVVSILVLLGIALGIYYGLYAGAGSSSIVTQHPVTHRPRTLPHTRSPTLESCGQPGSLIAASNLVTTSGYWNNGSALLTNDGSYVIYAGTVPISGGGPTGALFIINPSTGVIIQKITPLVIGGDNTSFLDGSINCSLAADSTGRFYLVSHLSQYPTFTGYVCRFFSTGIIDTTFGSSGFINIQGALNSENYNFGSLVIMNDVLYIVSQSYPGISLPQLDFYFIKMQLDGTITFNTHILVPINTMFTLDPSATFTITSTAGDPGNGYLLVSFNIGNEDAAGIYAGVLALNTSSGAVVSSFGGSGPGYTLIEGKQLAEGASKNPGENTNASGGNITTYPYQGQVVVGSDGYFMGNVGSPFGSTFGFWVAKMDKTGHFVSGWGTSGKGWSFIDTFYATDQLLALASQNQYMLFNPLNGKLYFFGYMLSPGQRTGVFVAGLTTSGQLDKAAFNPDGYLIVSGSYPTPVPTAQYIYSSGVVLKDTKAYLGVVQGNNIGYPVLQQVNTICLS